MKKLLFSALLVWQFAAQAFAAIGFDDLQPGSEWVTISNGYNGLQWNNFAVLNGTLHPTTEGYRTGMVSSNNVAFNREGGDASITGNGLFTLQSAYLTAAFVEGLEVRVLGFNGTNATYDNSFTVSTSAPTLVNFGYTNIDRVKFMASPESQFVMDDLVISDQPDAKPTLTVEVTDSDAAEGNLSGQFMIRRSGSNLNNSLTVSFNLSGTAQNGADYSQRGPTTIIPSGLEYGFVLISPVDDNLLEGEETVILTLSSNAAYNIGVTNSGTVVIRDNDNTQPPVVTWISPTSESAFGSPTNLLLQAAASDSDGTIKRVEFRKGSTLIGSVTNTNSFGYYGMTWSNAPTGVHSLSAKAIDNMEAWATSAPVVITITNRERPAVNVFLADESASESGSPAANAGSFRITRGGSTGSALNVYFQLGGSAAKGVDYTNISLTATIPAGSSNAFVIISPIDDTVGEYTETVSLVLSNHADYAYVVGTNGTKTLSIYDNDSLPTNPPVVAIITPTNGAAFAGPTNLLIRAQASDSDGYVAAIKFYAGTTYLGQRSSSSNSANFTAEMIWSNAPAGNHILKVVAFDNYQLATTSAPVNITVTGSSNTIKPTLTVQVADNSAGEGDGSGQFMIRRHGASISNALTVSFSLGGTAANGTDYSYVTNTATIAAGSSNAFVTINPVDDVLVEGSETVILTLSSNAAYNIGSPNSGTVSIKDNDAAPTNHPPFVSIITPTNGAVFKSPTNILIEAQAYDITNGWIDTVAFYAGTNLLGVVTNCPVCAYIQNPYRIVWEQVQPGSYILTAKAKDNQGAITVSSPVNITVNPASTNPPPQPIVRLVVGDAEATEGTNSNTANTASFTIRRTENTNVALTVYYDIMGTASNGVDYVKIPGFVNIPHGITTTNILIRPIDDSLVEGTESVTLRLSPMACIMVYPPPPECYLIGTTNSVTAYIYDNDPVTNTPPTVHLTAPTNGTSFTAPANFLLAAEASDSNGQVTKVEFFSGDTLLNGDLTAPYQIIWSNVTAGTYTLSAKATDNAGAFRWSTPVTITVRPPQEASFVYRKLPIWYVPNVKLTVQLRAEPKTNLTSYSIEDLPPTNWMVGLVSSNGVYDPADGKVKFTINQGGPRTLTYEVTPPANAQGEKHFSGTVAATGMAVPILGNKAIIHAPAHPADRVPTNFTMSSLEVSNYVHAWKRNLRWPSAPNPIPVSYVSRAGYLLAHGGGYKISTNFPTPFPPLLWVSTNSAFSHLFDPAGTVVNEVPWTTNHMGTAVSSMPTNYSVGVPFTVSITVTPAAGVAAYAVEDRPPKGWTVTGISDAGVFCPETGKVRWGVFMDGVSRILSYTVTPVAMNSPRVMEFAGVASFNGVNVPITGIRKTIRSISISPAATLENVKLLSDGNRLWHFNGTPGVGYVLEGSTNLADWQPVAELLNNDGALQFIDLATNQMLRFYRAVPKE